MRNVTSLYREGNSIAAGIRAAVVIVLLAAFAAAVDNVSMRPYTTALLAQAAPPATAAVSIAAEPVGIPLQLRAYEGEISAPVATF